MSGFLAINRTITERAKKYIMKRNVEEINRLEKAPDTGLYIFCAIFALVALFSGCWFVFIVLPIIILIKKIYNWTIRPFVIAKKLEKNQKKNEEYYNLLKTGILIHCDLKYESSKNDTKHADRVNMRYFYDLRYFDLAERVQVFKFVLKEMVPEESLKNIPLIFAPRNSKKAILFHADFLAPKMEKKGLWNEPRLVIQKTGEIDLP